MRVTCVCVLLSCKKPSIIGCVTCVYACDMCAFLQEANHVSQPSAHTCPLSEAWVFLIRSQQSPAGLIHIAITIVSKGTIGGGGVTQQVDVTDYIVEV